MPPLEDAVSSHAGAAFATPGYRTVPALATVVQHVSTVVRVHLAAPRGRARVRFTCALVVSVPCCESTVGCCNGVVLAGSGNCIAPAHVVVVLVTLAIMRVPSAVLCGVECV